MKSNDHDSRPINWERRVFHVQARGPLPCDERWSLSLLSSRRYRSHQRLRGLFHPVGISSPADNRSSLRQQKYEELARGQDGHLSDRPQSVSTSDRRWHVQRDTPVVVSIRVSPDQKALYR